MNSHRTNSRSKLPYALLLAATLLLAAGAGRVSSEEIWLYDNQHVYGLIQRVVDGKLAVFLPTGKEQLIPLEDVIAIRFLGRNPLLIQSGTQEFRFINGGTIRGQILGYAGDKIKTDTAMAGVIDFDLAHVKGFVSLPMIGFSSLKAEEMVEGETTAKTKNKDLLIDRRGSEISGVLREFERTHIQVDIDDLLQVTPMKILYLKGVRMADSARSERKPWAGDIMVAVTGRDNSVLVGKLTDIRFHKWGLQTAWRPESPLEVSLNEISMVQIMGGKVQYLSQLTPVKVEEKTTLAPPQPYQMNRSCQKDSLSIAGKRYPWGVGVHADSELTFLINARFQEFRSDIGIDSRIGNRGSIVFTVLGDGKQLYQSPVVKGADPKPREVAVSVAGVKYLTLKVTNANDLDLGDVANWGSARLLQVAAPAAPKATP